jgi:prolyl-tRNA editing enzyme YbaK/EbsC (Cys-tRNA(Pro) deacylase)
LIPLRNPLMKFIFQAGNEGLNIRIPVADLAKLTNARFASVCVDSS